MRRALAAGLLVVALSGCFGEDGAAFVTAMDLREVADGHARAWAEDAVLLAVHGRERRPGGGDGLLDPQREALGTVADPRPGDGRAHAWAYTYRSDTSDPPWLRLRVDGDGGVIDSGHEPPSLFTFDSAACFPLDNWILDSSGAAFAARDSNWSAFVADPFSTLDLILAQRHSMTPYWYLLASNVSGVQEIRRVEAVSGAVHLGGEAHYADCRSGWAAPPGPEEGTFEGSFPSATVENRHTWEVMADGHAWLRVSVSTGTGFGGAMSARLEAPNGTVSESGWVLPTTSAWRHDHDVELPGAGAWNLTLRYDGVSVGYVVDWCAASYDRLNNGCL